LKDNYINFLDIWGSYISPTNVAQSMSII